MEFLKPVWLWGLSAIVIPIVIHFWYQKKGETIWWAASQWLSEKTTLKHRGARLDEIPLMLVRCLLLAILALILSEPLLKFWRGNKEVKKVHLVENNAKVLSSFRFELSEALSKGEKVYLSGEKLTELSSLDISTDKENAIWYLQKNVTDIAEPKVQLHLYLSGDPQIADIPKIYIPSDYIIHNERVSGENNTVNYLNIGNGAGLYIDATSGALVEKKMGDIGSGSRRAQSVHEGPVKIALSLKDETSRRSTLAAWRALEEIYHLPVSLDTSYSTTKTFDIAGLDDQPEKFQPHTLYFIVGKNEARTASNVLYVRDSLRPESSEMVRDGRLPEWFAGHMVKHFGLSRPRGALNMAELKSRFILTTDHTMAGSGKWFLPIFLILLFVERGMVYRKGLRNA